MDYNKDFKDEYFQTPFGNVYAKAHIGTGPVLIFLHGLGANSMAWSRLMEHLSANYTIYLVDLLGHGKSDAPHIGYSVQVQARALDSLANKIGRESFIVGHSYGAWVAAYYSASYKESVKGLVLVDPAGIKENFEDIMKSGREEEYKEKIKKEALLMNGNREYVISSILENESGQAQLDKETLSRILCPVLLIWGRNDNIVDVKYAGILKSEIKNSTLELLDAGHNPHYTHADKVARAIEVFVDSNAQAQA